MEGSFRGFLSLCLYLTKIPLYRSSLGDTTDPWTWNNCKWPLQVTGKDATPHVDKVL